MERRDVVDGLRLLVAGERAIQAGLAAPRALERPARRWRMRRFT